MKGHSELQKMAKQRQIKKEHLKKMGVTHFQPPGVQIGT